MAPKKKGGKKANDDWDAGLGESPAPQVDAADGDAQEDNDDENGGSGGLMALMRKNKEKRKKKGIADDFVQGEDPPSVEPAAGPADKAPEEASLDDEFALPAKKIKGQAKNKQPQKAAATDDTGADGRILTKAEKEKLKKEREKQRKKEQVCLSPFCFACIAFLLQCYLLPILLTLALL